MRSEQDFPPEHISLDSSNRRYDASYSSGVQTDASTQSPLERFDELLQIKNNDGSNRVHQENIQSLYVRASQDSSPTGLRLFYFSSFMTAMLLMFNSLLAPAVSAHRGMIEEGAAVPGLYSARANAQIEQVKALLEENQRQRTALERSRVIGSQFPDQGVPTTPKSLADLAAPTQIQSSVETSVASSDSSTQPQSELALQDEPDANLAEGQLTLSSQPVALAALPMAPVPSAVPPMEEDIVEPATQVEPISIEPPEVRAAWAPPMPLVFPADEVQHISDPAPAQHQHSIPANPENTQPRTFVSPGQMPVNTSWRQDSQHPNTLSRPHSGAAQLLPLTPASGTTSSASLAPQQPQPSVEAGSSWNAPQPLVGPPHLPVEPDMEAPILFPENSSESN